jgi:ABC-type bacteriocin/lantibiotic exporter with double-glycine peptidase domain
MQEIIGKAAQKAQADGFIIPTGRGLSTTVIGERGTTLSGGQRQTPGTRPRLF